MDATAEMFSLVIFPLSSNPVHLNAVQIQICPVQSVEPPGPNFTLPQFFSYFALLDRQFAWIGKTCPHISSIFIKLLFLHPLLVARVC